MQFHLNGFKPGDPHNVYDRKEHEQLEHQPEDHLPAEIDVLIIGSGPAGLALAAQLSHFPDIKTRIVEQKAGRLVMGQADGLACRSLEMFEAYGFAERVVKEAYWVNETTFWKPDERQSGRIVRSGRIQDVEDGLSEFPHVILNQARVHDFFLDVMRRSPTRLVPSYSRRLIDLRMDEGCKSAGVNGDVRPDSHEHFPIEAHFERSDHGHEGEVEKIRAQYVVGCDGARSAVRRSSLLGLELKGDSANQAWGVMDVLAVTNFPDIRYKTAIHSATEGSILIIPREGGYLVRLYIELEKLNADERVASKHITADHLIAAAKRIFQPYDFEVKEVAWWSVYEIAQRLTERFDNVRQQDRESRVPNVFIAGDACHTHSPKAGQGMNVSMQDGYNLGWKLVHVLRGWATPKILHTYSLERQDVAQRLIDFDREMARMFSARPKKNKDDVDGIDPAEFQKFFTMQGRFTAGFGTHYAPGMITAVSMHQHLASGFEIGTRFHSALAIRLTDAKPVHLGHTIKADGRWRLFAFADSTNPAAPGSQLANLCDFLANSTASPLKRYTPLGVDCDSVFDFRAVLQQAHTAALSIDQMPDILWPRKGRYQLHDYEKVFCGEPVKEQPSIFDLRGVNRQAGCLVVVRPDQYIANILPLHAFDELSLFFERFMLQT